MSPIIVLAGTGTIAVLLLVIYAILVTGIRRGDRRNLVNAPRSTSDALSRRLLVGIRYSESDETGAGE